MRTVHGSPYTFSVKPKWRTVVLWFFAARSSAEAYFRSSPPRGHSTVGFPMRCEGFVAIWLGAREDIAHNRFQLLFIYIDYIILVYWLYYILHYTGILVILYITLYWYTGYIIYYIILVYWLYYILHYWYTGYIMYYIILVYWLYYACGS